MWISELPRWLVCRGVQAQADEGGQHLQREALSGRGQHQQRDVVRREHSGVRSGEDQAAHDGDRRLRYGVLQRRAASFGREVGVGARCQERVDDVESAPLDGSAQRGLAVKGARVGPDAGVEHALDDVCGTRVFERHIQVLYAASGAGCYQRLDDSVQVVRVWHVSPAAQRQIQHRNAVMVGVIGISAVANGLLHQLDGGVPFDQLVHGLWLFLYILIYTPMSRRLSARARRRVWLPCRARI